MKRRIVELSCQDVWKEMVNYTEGDLTEGLRKRVEQHLSGCAHCRAVYDGSNNVVRLLGSGKVFALPSGFSRRLYERLAHVAR